jgi:dTDP-4-dehydrorhamnose 3,5-epimerase
MRFVATDLPEVIEITPVRHGDDRGWFSEIYRTEEFSAATGFDEGFVQDNESFSAEPGTLRGIHYQVAPFVQVKLVRVVSGAVLDVAIDLRRGSPTFGHHVAVTLAASVGNQLLIPSGFGHALCTLEPNTHVEYKVSSPYAPSSERSVRWNDPALGIGWPSDVGEPVLSPRDAVAPLLADQPDIFEYETG